MFHFFDKGYLETLRRYLFWKVILLPGTKWETYRRGFKTFCRTCSALGRKQTPHVKVLSVLSPREALTTGGEGKPQSTPVDTGPGVCLKRFVLAADMFPYEWSVAFVTQENPWNLTLTENPANPWRVIWKSVCRISTEG